ncbi:MAG: AsmA family protein, partial [Gammaproteobacteria bacterium]
MRWIKYLLVCLIIVVVIIGGGLGFLLTLDLNDHKERIAAMVERFTGRTLVLDGRVDLDLGELTSLELTDARFGNPDWATEPWMARLARGKVVINVRSLLEGPIVIEQFELDDAELHLESLKDGRNNWTFGAVDAASEDASPDSEFDPETDSDGFPLVLRHAQGEDLFFTLALPALPRRLEIHADELTQQETDDGLLHAKASGTLNERAIAVSGQYGPLGNLVKATDVQFDVQGSFDTLWIAGTAMIDDLTWPRRPTADLDISGPSIDDDTEMLGLPDLGNGGLDITFTVSPKAEGVVSNVSGNIGEYTAEATARAMELLSFRRFDVVASLGGPDLDNALRIAGIEGIPGGPFQLDGGISRDDRRLEFQAVRLSIAAADLKLDGSINDFRNIDEADLDLEVTGSNVERFRQLLGIPGAATGPFRIDANLNVQPGGEELLEASIETGILRVDVDGSIVGAAPDFSGTTLAFDGRGKNLAHFTDLFDVPNPIAEPFSISGQIQLGDRKLALANPAVLEVGDNRVAIDGTIAYELIGKDTVINARASGGDLARIAAMAGVTEFVPAVAFDVRSGVAITGKGYRLRGLDAKLGENEIKFDGLISNKKDLAGTSGTFSATGPEFGNLLADTESFEFADGPFEVSGNAELLTDAVRLQGIKATIAGATATLDAEVGLPLDTASGQFDLTASGPDLRAVLPVRPRWQPPAAPFDFRAKGSLADGLWSFEALDAQLADATLSGNGVFDQPPDLSRTQLTITADVPQLAALGTLDGRPLPPTHVSVDMGFAGTPKSFSIDPFKVLIDDGDIQGSLRAQLDRDIPDVDLRLVSKVVDLDALINDEADLTGETVSTEDAEELVPVDDDPSDGRLIPDTPLPLEQLKSIDASIDIDVDTLIFNKVSYTGIAIDGEILDGRLVVDRATASTPHGDLSATLSVLPSTTGADVTASLDGDRIYIGFGGERTPEQVENSPKVNTDIKLSGSGRTYRELASSVGGRVYVAAEQGQVPNTGLRFFAGGFFQELLTTLNPFVKEDPFTDLKCLVILLDVHDGIIEVNPGLVAQTDKIIVAARGDIDLTDEKVDIGFKTQPSSRLSISAAEFINPYMKVAGTLESPVLTLDPTGTLVTGGAAVATAGLSVLATALYNRVFRAKDPCAEAVKQWKKE